MLAIWDLYLFDGTNLKAFYYWIKSLFSEPGFCVQDPAGHRFDSQNTQFMEWNSSKAKLKSTEGSGVQQSALNPVYSQALGTWPSGSNPRKLLVRPWGDLTFIPQTALI